MRTLPAQQKGLCCSALSGSLNTRHIPAQLQDIPQNSCRVTVGAFGMVDVSPWASPELCRAGVPVRAAWAPPALSPLAGSTLRGEQLRYLWPWAKAAPVCQPRARALGVPAGTAELSTSGHRDNKGRVPPVLGNLSGGAEELPAEPGPARGSGPDLGGQGVSWVSFGRLWGGFRGSAPLLAPGPAHTQGNKTQQWLWLLRDPAQPIPPQAQRAQCVPSTGRGPGGSPGPLTQAVSPQSIAQTPPLLPQTAHETGMGLSVAFLGISHGEAPAQLLLQLYLPL